MLWGYSAGPHHHCSGPTCTSIWDKHTAIYFIIIAELAPPWLFRLGPHLRFMIDSRALLSSSTCTSPLRRQHIPVGEGDRGARELKPDIYLAFSTRTSTSAQIPTSRPWVHIILQILHIWLGFALFAKLPTQWTIPGDVSGASRR